MTERASDEAAIGAAATPRPEALCAQLARRIEPVMGFVIYGIVWIFVSMIAGLLAALLAIPLRMAIGGQTAAIWFQVTLWILFWAGAVAAWVVYARSVRRKRGAARMLVREGELITGQVATRVADRVAQGAARLALLAAGPGLRVTWYRVVCAHPAGNFSVLCPFATRPEEGSARTVLYRPGYPYALAFDERGRAVVCGVHGA